MSEQAFWPIVHASEIARIEIGGTPSRNVPQYWAVGKVGHLWVSIADMAQHIIHDTSEKITDAGVKNSNTKPVPKGTVLMSFKLTVGRVSVAGVPLYTNEAVAAFHANQTRVSTDWLYRILPVAAGRVVTDTAIKGATLNKSKLSKMLIDLPPLPEQYSITTILNTLDETIRETDALVNKLKMVRQGLLHDLLTRGVDENGELRSFDPLCFRNGPLGMFPKEWSICTLSSIASVDRGQFTHRPRNDQRFYGGEFPFIQTGDITSAQCKVLTTYTQTLNRLGTTVSREFPVGTIAITIAANIADTTILGIPMYFPDSIVGAVVKPPNSIRYVEMSIRRAKIMLEAGAPQSAQKNINLTDLRPLFIALPLPAEQQRIAAIHDAHELLISNEEDTLSKLHLLRHGLMSDLLTGCVRTTSLPKLP